MLRFFLSPGAIPMATFSPALRLVCQAAKPCFGEIGKQQVLIICPFTSQFHSCLLIRKIETQALTTRWPSTQVAANWSGGRWRAGSFPHQGADFELPWSARSSSSPVVTMTMEPPSPRSCPGTQSPSLGNKRENLLWREEPMQLSPFQNQLWAHANSKWSQYTAHQWQF